MAAVGTAGGGGGSLNDSPSGQRRDFAEDIRSNQRNTILLITLLFILLGAIGWAVGYWFGFEEHGIVIALGIGVFMSVGAWFGGDKAILGIAGAKEADPVKDIRLVNIVDEMRLASGLPMPRVYIIETGEANAFATGRDPDHASVTVTRGLMNLLNREELQGVVAHEMAHVRNFDIRYMMLVAALVGSVVLMADMVRRYWWIGGIGGGRRSGGGRSGGGGYIQLILFVVSLLLIILAPLFAMLLQMSISRNREFLADARSVELTRNPEGLASALNKIDRHAFDSALETKYDDLGPDERRTANRAMQHLYIVNPVKSIDEYTASAFATHPPIRKRIERLRAMV
ncbi:M48 family metallopeptidase [bacterium]|nr:M48 family metallopeptidase [bacterium]